MQNKKKILVVDDETVVLESVSELLKLKGYTVVTATDAATATALAQDTDCIVLDLQLSPCIEMEGVSFLKHFWEDLWRNIPIIVFSGFLGIREIQDDLKQVERVWGKGRNIFKCVPKSGGVKPLLDAVDDCFKNSPLPAD